LRTVDPLLLSVGTRPIDSVFIVLHYGLVFVDPNGLLRGWIEPTENDPTVWDLHLMPGQPYPTGPAPAAGREDAS